MRAEVTKAFKWYGENPEGELIDEGVIVEGSCALNAVDMGCAVELNIVEVEQPGGGVVLVSTEPAVVEQPATPAPSTPTPEQPARETRKQRKAREALEAKAKAS